MSGSTPSLKIYVDIVKFATNAKFGIALPGALPIDFGLFDNFLR